MRVRRDEMSRVVRVGPSWPPGEPALRRWGRHDFGRGFIGLLVGVTLRELLECARRLRTVVLDRDRRSVVYRDRNLAIARNEHLRCASDDRLDVLVRDSDAR